MPAITDRRNDKNHTTTTIYYDALDTLAEVMKVLKKDYNGITRTDVVSVAVTKYVTETSTKQIKNDCQKLRNKLLRDSLQKK